jgi:DNA-binding LacI/PurR family transcriptional regulator
MGVKRVTLVTLAEKLGVSRSTISNAYNRPDQLSPELRARILAAADELGYAGPDPRASALRSGRAGAIGLIQKSLETALTDPASLRMLAGVARACDQASVALVIIPRWHTGDDAVDVVRTALVDGFVAHCDAMDPQRRSIVAQRGLPLVVLDGRADDDEAFVGVDDEEGARLAAEHVVALGHRRLAIMSFSDPDAGQTVTAHRLAGYRSALAAAGLDLDGVRVVDAGAYDRTAARDAIAPWLRGDDRPTAVLAMSDEFAAGALEAAGAAGLRVPDDLSIVGFDDTATAAAARPPLTTVRQPHEEKGAMAVRVLLDGAPRGCRVVLPVELVVRSTTAPPPR